MNQKISQNTVDKGALRIVLDRVHREIGFTPIVDATPEQSRALMLADGVRPEDNLFSCGIISARDED
jgi:hypothetical protein